MLHNRYEGQAFERRFLARLTTEEVEELEKDDALVILPIGAVEQHGAHLPLYTDTLIGEGILKSAFDLLDDDENIWLLPPLPYGKSTEHLGAAGTMSLSASTLQAVIMDIGKSVAVSGFKRLLLFNTHGGNHDLLNMMARDIRSETGLMVFRLNPASPETSQYISEQEQIYGIHGGDVETSQVLDFKADWVHMEKSEQDFVQLPAGTKHLALKGTSYFTWLMEDISSKEIAGNTTLATAEKGMKINRHIAFAAAEAFKEICRFDIENIKSRRDAVETGSNSNA